MPFQENTPCLGVGSSVILVGAFQLRIFYSLVGRSRERREKCSILKALQDLPPLLYPDSSWNIFMCKASHRKREQTMRRVTWVISHTNHQDWILTLLNAVQCSCPEELAAYSGHSFSSTSSNRMEINTLTTSPAAWQPSPVKPDWDLGAPQKEEWLKCCRWITFQSGVTLGCLHYGILTAKLLHLNSGSIQGFSLEPRPTKDIWCYSIRALLGTGMASFSCESYTLPIYSFQVSVTPSS